MRGIFILTVFVGILALFAASSAGGAIYESNGDFQLFDPGGAPGHPNPPLTDITRLSAPGGQVFTNQVAGAPFAVGSTVRSIGVFTVGTAINGANFPAILPDFSNLNVIFGIQGTIIPSGVPGIAAAKFTIGRAFLVSDATGNPAVYDEDHAATWNFPNVFAEFALKPMMDVIDVAFPGSGVVGKSGTFVDGSAHVSLPAAITNISGVNTLASLAQQGFFLFTEDSTAAQNAGVGFVNPGIGVFTGDDFMRDVDVSPLFPGKISEDIVTVTNQTALVAFDPPTVVDLAVMDAIGFAAGFTGPFSAGFTPSPLGIGTGDFIADLTADNYPGYQTPEPASLLVWFGVAGGFSLILYLRRRGYRNACAEA